LPVVEPGGIFGDFIKCGCGVHPQYLAPWHRQEKGKPAQYAQSGRGGGKAAYASGTSAMASSKTETVSPDSATWPMMLRPTTHSMAVQLAGRRVSPTICAP